MLHVCSLLRYSCYQSDNFSPAQLIEFLVSFDLTVPRSSSHSLSIAPKSCSYSPMIPFEIILTIMDAAYNESQPNNKATFKNFRSVTQSVVAPCPKASLPPPNL